MDVAQIYALTLYGAFVATVGVHVFRKFYKSYSWLIRLCFLRYLRCPTILRSRRCVPRLGRLNLLLYTGFASVIAALNIIGIASKGEAISRTGLMSVVTLIPLYASTQLSFIADLLNINLAQMKKLHRLLGLVCLLEGMAHTALTATEVALNEGIGLFGLIAAISLGLSFLLPFLQRYAHELLSILHVALGICLVSCLWVHLQNFNSKYCSAGAMILLLISTFFRFARVIFKNMSLLSDRKSRFTTLKAEVHAEDLIKIEIALPKRWKIRPGQYVYVHLPILNSNSWLQSHPFMVVSWTDILEDPESSGGTNLELVVKPRRGWTNYVLPALTGPGRTSLVKTFVDGPYGVRRDLGECSTVLMIATGIGIFAHIPYIQGLFDGYERSRIRTRKIKVFWQIDSEACTAWAFKWMQKFLDRDDIRDEDGQATFLHISLFLSPHSERIKPLNGTKRFGRRVQLVHSAIDGQKLFRHEIISRDKDREPTVVLSVSAERKLRDDIRRAISHVKGDEIRCLKGIDLLETDFQPEERRRHSDVV